jgi:metal-responsive CopG/Arc/MetJ family transcriptional regulator
MGTKQVSARLPEDDAERLEELCSEAQISKSEAMRRAVRSYVGKERDGPDLYRSLIVTGILFILVSETGYVPDTVVVLFGAILAAGLGYGAIRRPA